MPIYSRLTIKNNTKVSDILSNENINPIQKKIACVFDTNGDGIYTDKEVTLFNSTSSKEDSNGNITLWTNFSNGKKVKTTFSKEELILCTLKNNGNSVEKIQRTIAFDDFVSNGKGGLHENKVETYDNFNLAKYAEVREMRKKSIDKSVSKYNLIHKNINSELFNTSNSIIQEFHKEYGNPLSASMEYLLVSPFFKPNSNISNRGYKVDKEWHKFSYKNSVELLNKRSKLIKKYNYANCNQQVEMLVKLFYDNYKFKYVIKTIYTQHSDNYNKGHQAILITSKDSKEEYVIDTWICKDGGIFKKSDWVKLVSEIYGSNATIDVTNGYMGILQLEQEQNLL